MVFIDDVYADGKPSDHGGKYPLLSDAMKSGLFHPRCKDSSSLYIEGIGTSPDREVLPKKAQEDLTEIERAEQKAAYGRRMEKMNKRLSKYALDPDNKKTYQDRAEQWSDYTEQWSDYHNKLLEKAEKSGIIKTNKLLPETIALEDVQIYRSLGAMARNYDVMDFQTGDIYHIEEGTRIQNVQVFAGKGTRVEFKTAQKYADRYGGDSKNWQHVKGICNLVTPMVSEKRRFIGYNAKKLADMKCL